MKKGESQETAMAILEELEYILGPSTCGDVFIEIEEKYLGGELDIQQAFMKRRDLVERAIISILGEQGNIIFRQAVINAHRRIRHH